MARESCLWNKLKFGKQRIPLAMPAQEITMKDVRWYREGNVLEQGCDGCDEKKIMVDLESRKCKSRRWSRPIELVFIAYAIFHLTFIMGRHLYHYQKASIDEEHSLALPQNFVSTTAFNLAHVWNDDVSVSVDSKTTEPVEVFQVGYPGGGASASYGPVVATSVLVNETFGDSYNKPSVVTIGAPEVDFNKVVLTLNISASGVQYDRLANLFVDGVEIWRTSTLEPGNRDAYSTIKKDVSKFATLFAQEHSIVVFELDNLLTERLTGEFTVELVAEFFNGTESVSDDIFDISNRAADSVTALTGAGKKKAALKYLTDGKAALELPTVNPNTTRAILSIYTSGNADEEFWYTNVLDQFTSIFKFSSGIEFTGHGPLRVINAYVNGAKFATQAPEPIVFTGGISPALWLKVVANDAFDLPTIDIDVTGLLPLLWEGDAVTIELEVSNAIGELGKIGVVSGVGLNWITSASLLTYESTGIVAASGVVAVGLEGKKGSVFGIAPPFSGTLQQIATADLNTTLSANLTYILEDNSTSVYGVKYNTTAGGTNLQHYSKFGADQSLTHIGKTSASLIISNLTVGGENVVVSEYSYNKSYPLIMSSKQTEDPLKYPEDTFYQYNLTLAKKEEVALNGVTISNLKVQQNGTSEFYIGHELGNFHNGTGSLTTKYSLKQGDLVNYMRSVETVNGTIVSDSAIFIPGHDVFAEVERLLKQL